MKLKQWKAAMLVIFLIFSAVPNQLLAEDVITGETVADELEISEDLSTAKLQSDEESIREEPDDVIQETEVDFVSVDEYSDDIEDTTVQSEENVEETFLQEIYAGSNVNETYSVTFEFGQRASRPSRTTPGSEP